MRYGLFSRPRAVMSAVVRPGGEGNAQPAVSAAAAARNAAPLQIRRQPRGARSGAEDSDFRTIFRSRLNVVLYPGPPSDQGDSRGTAGSSSGGRAGLEPIGDPRVHDGVRSFLDLRAIES